MIFPTFSVQEQWERVLVFRGISPLVCISPLLFAMSDAPLPPGTEQEDGLLWTIRDQIKWAQTVYDVQVKIKLPNGTRGRDVDWKATATTVRFGVKGQAPILDGELDFKIKPLESTWSIDPENGEALVFLQKASKHENWKSVLKGVGVVDPLTSEEMGKKMLLEKFSAEVGLTTPD